MSDWKLMSRYLSDMAHKFGVALSTPDADNGFRLVGSNSFVYDPRLDCRFTKLTPKAIRRWLWENRHDPLFGRPDVLVYIERESPTSWIGKVGGVGSPEAETAIVFTEAA